MKSLYAKYDIYIRPVLKFALALVTFMVIDNKLGYLAVLNNLFVLVILSLICAILPLNGTVIIGILLIVAHCFGLGLEVGVFALALYLLMALLYFRFVPGDAIVMLLTPVSFLVHAPLAVPLCLGITGGATSVISSIFGVISWQFVNTVENTIAPMKDSVDASTLDIVQSIPKALLSTEVILLIIVFTVVILVETAIRKLITIRSYEVAVIVGTALYIFLMFAGVMILKVEMEIPELLIGAAISLVIGFILELFLFSVDYAGTEYVQFEDDKNYYYVRILPKKGTPPTSDDFEEPKENAAPQMTAAERESLGNTKVMTNPRDYAKNLEEALRKNTNENLK